MVYSYLGLSNPIEKVNSVLNRAITAYRKQNGPDTSLLSQGGVFSNNLSETAAFASANDMAIYTSADDLFRKSDIIFVFIPDSALRTLASSLRGHGIRDKIICHFSPGYDASVLDFDHMNTYVSLVHLCPDGSVSDFFVAEGYGDGYEVFLDAMNHTGIKTASVSSKDKSLMIAGITMASKLPMLVDKISDKLIKQAFQSNSEIGELVIDNKFDLDLSFNYIRNQSFLRNQKEAFLVNSMSDAGLLYGAYLSICALELRTNQNAKTEIKKIIGQMINESLEEI